MRSAPKPATFAVINMDPLKGNVILEIDPSITFSILDRVFGGIGNAGKYRHCLTDIESSAMEKIITRILGNMRDAWVPVLDLHPSLGQIDEKPPSAQIVPPAEAVAVVAFEVKIGDAAGLMNICIPYFTIEPVIGKFSAEALYSPASAVSPKHPQKNTIDTSNMVISVHAEVLRKTWTRGEILQWKAGTVLPVGNKKQYLPCTITAEGIPLFYGSVSDNKDLSNKTILIGKKADKENTMNEKEPAKAPATVEEVLDNLPVLCTVELGRKTILQKQLRLFQEGTILELDALAGDPIQVYANNMLIAQGETVEIDESYGVRITEVLGASHGQK
jgi:flagellar motor switch protein FliM